MKERIFHATMGAWVEDKHGKSLILYATEAGEQQRLKISFEPFVERVVEKEMSGASLELPCA